MESDDYIFLLVKQRGAKVPNILFIKEGISKISTYVEKIKNTDRVLKKLCIDVVTVLEVM